MEETGPLFLPIRFGIFEVDLQAGELRRQGYKVKLQEQPFQVLVMLLERSGEVVTREELQKNLWPADTFVDFERGLNRAINKLAGISFEIAHALRLGCCWFCITPLPANNESHVDGIVERGYP
jgi:hypothetical protein